MTSTSTSQVLHERVEGSSSSLFTTAITGSPYGSTRNSAYGWATMFGIPSGFSARVPQLPMLHIGTSSLNSVPGTRDRRFSTLFDTYQKKFSSLEHCYPYHRVGTVDTWASWKAAVRCTESSSSMASQAEMKERLDSLPSSAFLGGARPPPSSSASTESIYFVSQDRFMFTVKASKYLSHDIQLNCATEAAVQHVHLFFNELCRALDPHLGPVLIQLPPSFDKTPEHVERLRRFYQLLPQDELLLVYPHEGVDTLWSWERRRRIRIAVEFRHASWYHPETFALFREFQWAIVISDNGEMGRSRAASSSAHPFGGHIDTGVPFLYCRLHGSLGMYVGDYGPLRMRHWANVFIRFLSSTSNSTSAPMRPLFTTGSSTPLPLTGESLSSTSPASSPPPPPHREVYCFLNNNESHIQSVTSSTVDASYLAEWLRQWCEDQMTSAQSDRTTHPDIQMQKEGLAEAQAMLVGPSGTHGTINTERQSDPPHGALSLLSSTLERQHSKRRRESPHCLFSHVSSHERNGSSSSSSSSCHSVVCVSDGE